ncbi:hypothetical protein DIPPA_09494 [Diplonema papillatum]|nr:hypothetical protein DIPPA_17878 [Diplonema papillatum]KAJ9440543.1 hypothetical protein DIPPA_14262 [Diplonema papillatum]KAJ9462460.1 hypothetical protein DIPPA_09494 [Diplonema papillatum]|eukprot:gene17387-26720_t
MLFKSEPSLQQQQCEVEASLRVPVVDDASAERVCEAIEHIEYFMRDVYDAEKELGVGVDVIVQALLTRVAEVEGTHNQAFEDQAGSTTVPMHQRKIIDRSARILTLDANRVKDAKWVLKQVNENLPQLVRALQMLREFVKIKVEDASDIAMARLWSKTAHSVAQRVKAVSMSADMPLFAAWQAVEQGNTDHLTPAASPISLTASASMSHALSCSSLCSDGRRRGVGDVSLLEDTKSSFSHRLAVLHSLGDADYGDFDVIEKITADLPSLAAGLAVQLKDSRSQVLKASCIAVRRLCLATSENCLEREQWLVVASAAAPVLLSRLNFSNKVLAAEVEDTLSDVVKSTAQPIILRPLLAATTSPVAVTQSKALEAVNLWLGAHPSSLPGLGVEDIAAVASKARAGLESRHAAARAAAKAVLKTCAQHNWVEPPASPLSSSAKQNTSEPRQDLKALIRKRAAAGTAPVPIIVLEAGK